MALEFNGLLKDGDSSSHLATTLVNDFFDSI
jgi:hypothetical protein